MYAVGRLGSYISRGVYTVSGPFHPFGGAVDIIVVEQEDGSYKSSPWYVRFGKFQGVLKSKEKIVSICVDGVEPSFHMLLDNKGEAYFLREVVEGEEDETGLYPLCSVDSLDKEPQNGEAQKERWQIKSKSCNFDSLSGQANPMDMSKEKPVTTGPPNQSRIMGIFGRKPVEQASCEKQVDNKVVRRSSLERAEMATDLMDLQWSTNKKTNQPNASSLASVDKMVGKDLKTNVEQSQASPESSSEKPKRSSEEASVSSSSEKVVTFSTAGESVLEEKREPIALEPRESNEPCVDNKDHDGDANGITGPSSRVTNEPCVDNKDHDGDANGITGPSSRVTNEPCDGNANGIISNESDSQKNGLQPSLPCEMSDSSIAEVDDSSKQTDGTQCLGKEERGEALHTTTELPSEDMHNEQPAGDTKLETELVEHNENHCQQTDLSRPSTPERNKEDPKNSFTVTESNSQIHSPVLGSVEDVESHALSIIPSSSNSDQQVEDEKKFVDESIKSSPQSNIASGGDTEKLNADSLPTEVPCDAVSQSSEDEQFLFGDLDEDKLNAAHTVERKSSDHKDKEDHPSSSLEETEEKHKSVSRSHESCSSVDQFGRENPSVDSEKSIVVSNPIGIPRTPKAPGEGVGRLGESVPNMWFHVEDLNDNSNGCHSLSQSLDASPKSVKWRLQGKDDSNCVLSDGEQEGHLRKDMLDAEGAHTSGEPNSVSASPRSRRHSFGRQKSESKDMIAVDRVEKPSEGDSSKPPIPGRRWRIWPFVFRAARSTNDNPTPPPGYVRIPDSEDAADSVAESGVESVAESAEESPAVGAVESPAECVRKRLSESAPVSPVTVNEGENELRPKGVKKMFRALTPTSDQLASLKLNEGKNSITFTFSTGMLGDQQVDARIYLWKWNTRIVISDVDGTITKSDVLGQFMPLVGIDWCQTGVTQLFSAIKENGYQLLFLSARAIAQATTTRQFLLNIKQDGKALPDGPIVISPDGLFPSLFREVIRRAPHEFKIACLEDIKALFPENSNPFYAGFGNRDTDEISYLKVGIPMGKIFIINPKGEVAVNRRVDRKSYTSLHDLVHGMFPATEQEQEDFNSWNFWKLPSPLTM